MGDLNPDVTAKLAAGPAATASSASQLTTVEGFGVRAQLPFPGWVVACAGVLLLVASSVAGGYFVYSKMSSSTLVPKDQLYVYQASDFHSKTDPTPNPNDIKVYDFPGDGSTVTLHHYPSDGCVQIITTDNDTKLSQSKWIFGPRSTHMKGPATQGAIGEIPHPEYEPALQEHSRQDPLNHLDDRPAAQAQLKRVDYGGNCINPHPGAFNQQNEQVNQCVVKVWRYFQDGCIHYQFFNACNGSWDVYPNGVAHVYWTQCVH